MDQLNIVGKTFDLEFVDEIDEAGVSKSAYGVVNYLTQVIQIRADQHADQARDTLLHEILHVLDMSLRLGLKHKQIHVLATGLAQVLSDNPALAQIFVPVMPKRRRKKS